MINNFVCKLCQSDNVIKWGKYKGVQRYYCKACKSKFKADDSLYYMQTPVHQVTAALNMYFEGMSIKGIRRNLKQEHGNAPSTATIFEWIQKFSQYATDSIKGYKPKPEKIGETWVADETVLEIDGMNMWLFDLIDKKTRFILATRLTRSRTTRDAQLLYDKAVETAGKEPDKVLTDSLASYLDVRYGDTTEHIQSKPIAVENDTQMIERFHSTLKQRTKVMRGLKNFQSALDFLDAWLVHYNYLRPHTSLRDHTPAEASGIEYPYSNWADITKHKPSKAVVIEHQKRGSEIEMPRIQIGRRKKHVRISKKQQRISSPIPRLSEPMRKLK